MIQGPLTSQYDGILIFHYAMLIPDKAHEERSSLTSVLNRVAFEL